MPRLSRLLLATALTASFAFTGLGIGTAPASATGLPISQCTTTSGVILAVDFSHWGGPLLRSCGSVPTTGYQLLHQGGWATTGTQHDGPGFICRIGYSGFQSGTQYPTSATEACNHTPPASAYWSYWHADPGQNTWSYSQLGAASYKPANGGVDLWTYGGTDLAGTKGTPQLTPDSVRAHNVSSSGGGAAPSTHSSNAPIAGRPATSVPPANVSSNSTGAGSDSGMHRGAAASSGTTTPTARTTTGTAKPTRSQSASISAGANPTTSISAGTQIVDAEPAAATKHASGSFVPELVAGVLVLALGGAAGFTGWRRRQAR
jgi:hypothetical protein